jgi:DNA-binding MarR family transcriptional regulator
MKDTTNQCKRYLMDTLGINANLSRLPKPGSLPFFLHDAYEFFKLKLLEEDFIVIIPQNNEELTPATIKKHIDLVENKLNVKAIFLTSTISSFNRKRLIEYKVPFIVPDNQMYLPDLAIDLREHFIKTRSKPLILGPATQTVILYALAKTSTDPVTPKELTEKLGYSKMSMSRSIDEIEGTELAEVLVDGKNRLVRFEKNKRILWKKALPYLKTPVKESIWVKFIRNDWKLLEAGLTALAHYSLIAQPTQPVYAIRDQKWKILKQNHRIEILTYPDESEGKIEIWRYDPHLFAKDKTVDPFSLYLSLKDMEDERVEAALEEMMEKIEW